MNSKSMSSTCLRDEVATEGTMALGNVIDECQAAVPLVPTAGFVSYAGFLATR
jgi:hypothetical protein